MPGGRPTKLTSQVRAIILDAIARGHPYDSACEFADVDYSTYRDWMNGNPEFAEAVRNAEHQRDDLLLRTWHLAATQGFGLDAKPDWRAAREFLAVHRPERYAKQQKIEHSGSQELVVKVVKYSDDSDS